jgi:hypothetical protein
MPHNSTNEFKLFKTKSKLSNLLSTSSTANSTSSTNQSNSTPSYYILVKLDDLSNKTEDGIDSLWFNRSTGEVTFKKAQDLSEFDEISKVYGFIGKFQVNSTCSQKLLFIKKRESVGKIRIKSKEHVIFKLKEVLLLTLSPPGSVHDEFESYASIECDLITLSSPNSSSNLKDTENLSSNNQQNDTTSLTSNTSSSSLATNSSATSTPNAKTNNSETNKFEKRIIDEIIKIFQDNNGSFYFSYTYDLTNSVEKQQIISDTFANIHSDPNESSNWKNANDRFFWNKVLLKDLIDLHNKETLVDKFVLPLIQGYVQIENYNFPIESYDLKAGSNQEKSKNTVEFRIFLLSRRSRYRLGTRFKRRGVDENGNVANFVETEQVKLFFL